MKITNVDKLVKISVTGEIANPGMPPLPASPYLISADGEPVLIPAYGGLVYNVQIGDRAIGWAAELIQAGVSIKNSDGASNAALGSLCLHWQSGQNCFRDGQRGCWHCYRKKRAFCRSRDLPFQKIGFGEDVPGR